MPKFSFYEGVVHGHAGVIDGLVNLAEWISLGDPAEIVDGLGPIAFAGGVDFVDGDDFALLLGSSIRSL